MATERAMKDQFMSRHPESPFVQGSVYEFRGLKYFPADERLRVPAKLERLSEPKEAFLRTNRDGQAAMRWVGELLFQVGSRKLRLRVYHAGEGVGTSVFVPFRDGTSGQESYGPGRYLTLELSETDDYELDFNRAFNPYCAYTDAFECGFPPAENDLPVAIRAGEKVWSAERNPRTPSSAVIALLPPRPTATRTAPPARKPPAPRTPPRRRRAGKKPSKKVPAARRTTVAKRRR